MDTILEVSNYFRLFWWS